MVVAFHLVPLIKFCIVCLFVIGIFKFKSAKIKIGLGIVLLVMVIFHPIIFKQEGISKIERTGSWSVEVIPDRIYVNEESFQKMQLKEMRLLEKEVKRSEIEVSR